MSENTPKIRFKGFADAWEQRKLGEVADIYDGTHKTPNYTKDGIMFLSVENIGTLESNKYISHEAYISEFKIKPERNDVLMTRIGDIGTANVVTSTNSIAYYVSLALFKSKELNPHFLKNNIHSPYFQKELWKRTLHVAFPKKINKNEIESVQISLPALPEQTAIGTFFRTLDDTITLHRRKLDALKELKKGYLQQMFPQAGESVPRVRFAGFEGDWEQRKLGEVADIIGGGTPSTNIDEYWDGDIDWYAPAEISEQIFVSSSQKKITDLGLRKSSATILPVGSVLFTSRAGIGKTAILAKSGATNQGFQSIIPNTSKLDTYFIFARSNELKRYAETVGAGSTFVEVSGKQMAEMPMLFPTLEEQTAISNFFCHLDEHIANQNTKLNQLQQLKSAYLQKMFV